MIYLLLLIWIACCSVDHALHLSTSTPCSIKTSISSTISTVQQHSWLHRTTFSHTALCLKKDRGESDGSKTRGRGFGTSPATATADKTSASTTVMSSDQPLSENNDIDESQMTTDDKIKSTEFYQKIRSEKIRSLQEKLKFVQDEEQLIASDPSVGAVPELVAERMIKRIALFFGIPVFGGLMVFVGAFFYFKKFDLVIPPTIIAYATQFPFIIGLLGITYAILSSSWDEVSIITFNYAWESI